MPSLKNLRFISSLLLILALTFAPLAFAIVPPGKELRCDYVPGLMDVINGPRDAYVSRRVSKRAEQVMLEESNAKVKEIRKANSQGKAPKLDFLVIGAGPNSTVFTSTLRGADSKAQFMVFEAKKTVGTFHENGDVLQMFSPEPSLLNRKTNSGNAVRNNIVTPESLNDEARRYPGGNVAGETNVLAHRANGDGILFEQRVTKVERTPNGEPARYKVTARQTFEDGTTAEIFVYTDKIIDARGLGESKPAVMSKEGLAFLESEKAKAQKDPRYTPLLEGQDSLNGRVARMQLEEMSAFTEYANKKVLVVGPTVGGQAVAELLKHGGPATAYATHPEKVKNLHVTWMGTGEDNIAAFEKNHPEWRTAYHFPDIMADKEGFANRKAYVTGIRPATKEELAEHGKAVVVETELKTKKVGPDGKIVEERTKLPDEYFDHVVTGTGFQDLHADDIYKNLQPAEKTAFAREDVLGKLARPVEGAHGDFRPVAQQLLVEQELRSGIYKVGMASDVMARATGDFVVEGNDLHKMGLLVESFALQMAHDLGAKGESINLRGEAGFPANWHWSAHPQASRQVEYRSAAEAELHLRVALQSSLQKLQVADGGELKIMLKEDGSLGIAGVNRLGANRVERLLGENEAAAQALHDLVYWNERSPKSAIVSVPFHSDGRPNLEKALVGKGGADSLAPGVERVRGHAIFSDRAYTTLPREAQLALDAREAEWESRALARQIELAAEAGSQNRLRLLAEEENYRAIRLGKAIAEEGVSFSEGFARDAVQTVLRRQTEHLAAALELEAEARRLKSPESMTFESQQMLMKILQDKFANGDRKGAENALRQFREAYDAKVKSGGKTTVAAYLGKKFKQDWGEERIARCGILCAPEMGVKRAASEVPPAPVTQRLLFERELLKSNDVNARDLAREILPVEGLRPLKGESERDANLRMLQVREKALGDELKAREMLAKGKGEYEPAAKAKQDVLDAMQVIELEKKLVREGKLVLGSAPGEAKGAPLLVSRGERVFLPEQANFGPTSVIHGIQARLQADVEELNRNFERLAAAPSPEKRVELLGKIEDSLARRVDQLAEDAVLNGSKNSEELAKAREQHAAIAAQRLSERDALLGQKVGGKDTEEVLRQFRAESVEAVIGEHFPGMDLDAVNAKPRLRSFVDGLHHIELASRAESDRLALQAVSSSLGKSLKIDKAASDDLARKLVQAGAAPEVLKAITPEKRLIALKAQLKKEGWKPEQINACGALCTPQLKPVAAEGEHISSRANLVLSEGATLDHDAKVAQDAQAIVEPLKVKGEGTYEGAMKRLKEDREAIEKELEAAEKRAKEVGGPRAKDPKAFAVAKEKVEHLREAARILDERITSLEEFNGVLKGTRPLSHEESIARSTATSAFINYAKAMEGRVIELADGTKFAMPEGFSKLKGIERFGAYEKLKGRIALLSTENKVALFKDVERFLQKGGKTGFAEKLEAGAKFSFDAKGAIEIGDRVAFITGDKALAQLASRSVAEDMHRLALLEVMGATKAPDNGFVKGAQLTKKIAETEDKVAELSRVAKLDRGSTIPKREISSFMNQELSAAEMEKTARGRFDARLPMLKPEERAELARAVSRFEKNESEAAVKSAADRIADRAGEPNKFLMYREAYLHAAEFRAQGMDADKAWLMGFEKMLLDSGAYQEKDLYLGAKSEGKIDPKGPLALAWCFR